MTRPTSLSRLTVRRREFAPGPVACQTPRLRNAVVAPEEIEEYATAQSALANARQASGSPCADSAPESVSISQQPGSP